MILPFSTQMNGKPTYFVEKILASLISQAEENKNNWFILDLMRFARRYAVFSKIEFYELLITIKEVKPKHHTIREDSKERWNDSCLIHFFINARTKLMFLFAPILIVKSTQKVEIYHNAQSMWNDNIARPSVYVDGYDLHLDKIRKLAQNDGFDTIEDFFEYFNKDFTGKIIHWTDLRY